MHGANKNPSFTFPRWCRIADLAGRVAASSSSAATQASTVAHPFHSVAVMAGHPIETSPGEAEMMRAALGPARDLLWDAFLTDVLASLLRRFSKAPGYDMLPTAAVHDLQTRALRQWLLTAGDVAATIHTLYVPPSETSLADVANGTVYHRLLPIVACRLPNEEKSTLAPPAAGEHTT
ncbi:MAG TPA: hypothetical protein VF006_34175 [Longimicrobium sp.]